MTRVLVRPDAEHDIDEIAARIAKDVRVIHGARDIPRVLESGET